MSAAPFITVRADDTTDVCCRCQLPVTLRYLNEKGNACKRFSGFEDVSAERDAMALAEVIMGELRKYKPEEELICQRNDGASFMRGQRKKKLFALLRSSFIVMSIA